MGLLICLTLIAVTSLHNGELKETVNDKRQMKSKSRELCAGGCSNESSHVAYLEMEQMCRLRCALMGYGR